MFSKLRPISIHFRLMLPRRAFGGVAASLRRSGRKPAARAYDALIAAIAIANDLPLYTSNPSDFAGIDGLTAVPVLAPSPDEL